MMHDVILSTHVKFALRMSQTLLVLINWKPFSYLLFYLKGLLHFMPKEGNTSSIALTNRPAGEYNLKDKGRKQNLSHLCFFFTNRVSTGW